MTRTKVCTECKEELPDTSFNLDNGPHSDGLRPKCVACRSGSGRPDNLLSNAISRIAARIAGSSRKLYELTSSTRREIRETARRMYELGHNIAAAEANEATTRNGFVYVITNPAWPGHVKIGRAFNPESRLGGYQTSCPNRDYELHYAVYFHDCYHAETEMHSRLAALNANGEWYRMTVAQATDAINQLRETI